MPNEFTPLLSAPETWCAVRKKLASCPPACIELTARADAYLSSPGYSVTDKPKPPPGGTLHDYASLSKYYWPDPDTPDGLPWIGRDGVRNPAADDYDFPRLLELCLAVTTLAGSARLTGEETYACKAGQLLRRWFLEPATRMNPNLDYAQFSPGNFQGSPTGVIDCHFFCELLEAVRALDFNREWRPEHLKGLRSWFREFLDYLSTSPLALAEEAALNNHGTWYDALFISIALFTGQEERALRQLREKSLPRLDGQLDAEAAMPREQARTLSLTYCYFNLLGWSWVAGQGKTLGVDLWRHPNRHGISLRDAFLRLLPAFLGEAEWQYRQIGPRPRGIEYCRLFAVVMLLDDIPEVRRFLDGSPENPVWRIPSFATDDDWQQPPRGSQLEKEFFAATL